MMESVQDLVTVVIPVYNDFRFLKETIESVFSQTYQNFEIIVVDDCSTNGDALKEFVTPYLSEKCRYTRNAVNKGLAGSRNVGIGLRRGEFICFLDADDVFCDRKLEVQVAQFKSDPVLTMVFSDEYVIRDHKRITAPQQFPNGFDIPKPVINRFVQQSFIAVFTVMLRTRVLKEVGIFTEVLRWNEDDDLWFRIMLKSEPAFTDYVTGYRRLHDQNMSLNRVKMFYAQLNTFSNWITICKKEKRPDLQKIIRKRALGIANTYFRTTIRRGKFDLKAARFFLNIYFN